MNIRRIAKASVAAALYRTGLDRAISRAKGTRAPLVLGYHRVVDDFSVHVRSTIPAMLTSRRMLERHLDWLGERFRFVSLDELGKRLEQGRPLSKPVAALTFDDGYRDVYEHAFPVLKARRIPAAIFVATNFVAEQAPLAHDRLYLLVGLALQNQRLRAVLQKLADQSQPFHADWRPHPYRSAEMTSALLASLSRGELDHLLRRLETELGVSGTCLATAQPLTWQMLAEMHRGGITIGCHTASHSVLTNESPATALDEVRRSREVLERRLGIQVRHFAYPDGRFNRGVVRAVAQAGARFGYTTCQHRDPAFPLLTIPRRLLWERSCLDVFDRFSPSVMSSQVHGVLEFMNPCAENHGADCPGPHGHSASGGGSFAAAAPLL